jgi:hypothetical protein
VDFAKIEKIEKMNENQKNTRKSKIFSETFSWQKKIYQDVPKIKT